MYQASKRVNAIALNAVMGCTRMKNEHKLRKFNCIGCGKEVEARRSKTSTKYCSMDCFRKTEIRQNNRNGKVIKCGICGKKKYLALYRLKDINFCSRECANEYLRRNKVNFICKICGKGFSWSKSRLKNSTPTYCSMECRNKDSDHMIKCGLNSTIKQHEKMGLNKLELEGRGILKELGIRFNEQVLMFNKFLVDVLLKDKPIIIQWDGEYWHTKRENVLRDKSQDAYLKKCGYTIIRITDKEIKNNLEEVYANITSKMC